MKIIESEQDKKIRYLKELRKLSNKANEKIKNEKPI